MNNSKSLRGRLFTLMSILVALQSIALVITLAFSRVFFHLDGEAFRIFDTTIASKVESINKDMGNIMENTLVGSKEFSEYMIDTIGYGELDGDSVFNNAKIYGEIEGLILETVLSLLKNNDITGAYIILNDEFHNKDKNINPAIYIRDSSPEISSRYYSKYMMEKGPIYLSQKYQIPLGVNWDKHIDFETLTGKDFYNKPLEAVKKYPGLDICGYGYWTTSGDILGDSKNTITYSLPLLDRKGHAFGVIGIEISNSYFKQHYLSYSDIPYDDSFYIIVNKENIKKGIGLEWFIPSNPIGQIYLENETSLHLKDVRNSDLYKVELEGLGEMYCLVSPLKIYGDNSPFYSKGWSLIGFAPKESLHSTSHNIQSMLMGSILGTTIISVVAIFLLTYASTRKISRLSKYIKGINPYQEVSFIPTGLREIDELTFAIEKLNRSVLNSSKVTSTVMELTDISMGYFELIDDNEYIMLTNYIYDLIGVENGTQISKDKWEDYYKNITARPSEELENVFYYKKINTDEYKWLRINMANTENSIVGIIMDVSEDIEKNRSLTEELQYDRLTNLYNREAFKRKVHCLIKKQPDKIGAMVFIDLDNLKYINDSYGHDIGDKYLKCAAEIFNKFSKLGGIVSRISGDEFGIYLHGYDSEDEINQVLSTQLNKDSNHKMILTNGEKEQVRYSAGVAWYPKDSNNESDLLKLSDFAMYEAKHMDKGSIKEFNKDNYHKNMCFVKS